MDYEKTLEELDGILKDMESPDIKLEDMMTKYKRAVTLYKELEEYLKEYKKEIKLITDKGLVDFNEEEIDEDVSQ